jgi:hypothetical protein
MPRGLDGVSAPPPAKVKSRPAPIGGLNTRDDIGNMPDTDAITLDNWFPDVGKVTQRKGFTGHATGVGSGLVETLAEYNSGTTRKLLAAGANRIYDATSAAAATSLAHGFTNPRWQTANFNAIQVWCNGSDTPQHFDGTTITASTWTGSGLTTSNLVGVNVFKNRLFFWENNSQDFWYAAINAVTGTLTKFPLSRVSRLGGNLMAMATWTIDGGAGLDDMAVFIMTSGDVVVYQGTDPGDASAWSLVGVYQIGAPVNIRGQVQLGGDLGIIAQDDFVSLTRVLRQRGVKTSDDLSKISGAMAEATAVHSSKNGWQAILYPRGKRVILNIPMGGTETVQFVVNTVTGAWCKFKGFNTPTHVLFNDRHYFGGLAGEVFLADETHSDNGTVIDSDAQQAWTTLGTDQKKQVTAARPIMEADGTLTTTFGVAKDFGTVPDGTDFTSGTSGAPWDTSLWDVTSWSTEDNIRLGWRVVGVNGHNVSPRVRVQSQNQEISWFRTEYLYIPGALAL